MAALQYLPFQNSSLEIGYSFQSKSKTGEVGTAYQNTGVVMQAVDLNYLGHLNAIKSDIRYYWRMETPESR